MFLSVLVGRNGSLSKVDEGREIRYLSPFLVWITSFQNCAKVTSVTLMYTCPVDIVLFFCWTQRVWLERKLALYSCNVHCDAKAELLSTVSYYKSLFKWTTCVLLPHRFICTNVLGKLSKNAPNRFLQPSCGRRSIGINDSSRRPNLVANSFAGRE